MAVKVFTNEQLTSSDTNQFLANSGLVYVTSTTIGSAVSSVTVSNCFSSTYDNYRIMVTGGAGSTQMDLGLKLGSTTTGYTWALSYVVYGTNTPFAYTVQNTGNYAYAGAGTTNILDAFVELRNPYNAKYTMISSYYTNSATGSGAGTCQGFLANTTSYTDFTIVPNTGTMTGGTITVYGYRKA